MDVKVLQLSTKSSSGTILNGNKKSLVTYNIRDYIDFEGDNTIDYVQVSLPYACIPNSSYNVSEKNNMLSMSFDGNLYNYTFPVGNYTVSTFIAMWATIVPTNFALTYSGLTSKFTITTTSYSFTVNAESTIDYTLGFSGTTSSTLTSAYTLVMPRCYNFLPEPVFNICCPEISNGQALSNGGRFQFSNILATVPNSGKNNVQTVYQSSGEEFILKTSSYNQLTIQILSDEGAYIDFNGVACFFALQFKIHRKVLGIHGSFLDFAGRSASLRLLQEVAEEE